jgi:hypothetical protein
LGVLLQRFLSLESWCVSACKLWNENCHQKVPWICPKDGTTARILLSALGKDKFATA